MLLNHFLSMHVCMIKWQLKKTCLKNIFWKEMNNQTKNGMLLAAKWTPISALSGIASKELIEILLIVFIMCKVLFFFVNSQHISNPGRFSDHHQKYEFEEATYNCNWLESKF